MWKESLRKKPKATVFSMKEQETLLKWYGYVMRRSGNYVGKMANHYVVIFMEPW